jgi:hypothetical protein
MNLKQIRELVEKETGVDVSTRSNATKITIARGIYYNLAYDFANATYKNIAEEIGYCLTQVFYWREKIHEHLPYEPEYKHIYYKLRRNLRSGSFEEAEALIMDEQAEEVLTQMIAV